MLRLLCLLFRKIDTDHSGCLDKTELAEGLQRINLAIPDTQQLDIIWHFMSRGSGTVDCTLWTKFLAPLPEFSFRQLEDKYMELNAAKDLSKVGRLNVVATRRSSFILPELSLLSESKSSPASTTNSSSRQVKAPKLRLNSRKRKGGKKDRLFPNRQAIKAQDTERDKSPETVQPAGHHHALPLVNARSRRRSSLYLEIVNRRQQLVSKLPAELQRRETRIFE